MWLWLASWADCRGPRPALSGSERLSQSKIGCDYPHFSIASMHFPCVFLMFFLLSTLFYSLSFPNSTIILSLVCLYSIDSPFCIIITDLPYLDLLITTTTDCWTSPPLQKGSERSLKDKEGSGDPVSVFPIAKLHTTDVLQQIELSY